MLPETIYQNREVSDIEYPEIDCQGRTIEQERFSRQVIAYAAMIIGSLIIALCFAGLYFII